MATPYEAFFRRGNRLNALLAERARQVVEIKTGGVSVRFHCPNSMTLMRARTLLDKEPDTIAWIDGFAPGDLLFDVGANVGTYSIYAGARGINVRAFEPESQNYAALNRNIHLNGLQESVVAYNFAVGRQAGIDVLYLGSFRTGDALHNLGEARGFDGRNFIPEFKQGVAAYTLDGLVYASGMPVPRHLKIDVDGLEPDIITGAERLLSDEALRSVLVELDTRVESHRQVVRTLEGKGYGVVSRYHSPIFAGTEFEDIFNFIFRRD